MAGTKKVKISCATCDACGTPAETFDKLTSVKPTSKVLTKVDKYGKNITPKLNTEIITYRCEKGHEFTQEQRCR